MDTDLLFELCHLREDELKERLIVFMGCISDFQNRIIELENRMDSCINDISPGVSKNDVIDDYWKLYSNISEMHSDFSKYQYASARLGYINQYKLIHDTVAELKEYTAFYICAIMEQLYPSTMDPLTNPMRRRVISQNKQNSKDMKNCMIRLNSIKL